MRDIVIHKQCTHCGITFRASCGKEAFCSDECKIYSNVGIDAVTGCWNWQRSKDSDGYGYMKAKGGKSVKAHRAAYQIFKGEIQDGLMVCHSCDNPSCCNPAHLFLGTAKDNKHDCMQKMRHAKGEAHYKAKLKESDVVEILAGTDAAPSLAERFGVHRNMIYSIRKGESWRHLQYNGLPVVP